MKKQIIFFFFFFIIINLFSEETEILPIYEYSNNEVVLRIFPSDSDGFSKYYYMGKIEIVLSYNGYEIERKKARFSSSWIPYYINDNYLTIAMKDFNGGDQIILVVNFNNPELLTFRTETVYVGTIFLYDDFLFYSTEKNDFTISKINLIDSTIRFYTEFYLPNADFFNYQNQVYAISDYSDKKNVYLVNDKLEKIPREGIIINVTESTSLELKLK